MRDFHEFCGSHAAVVWNLLRLVCRGCRLKGECKAELLAPPCLPLLRGEQGEFFSCRIHVYPANGICAHPNSSGRDGRKGVRINKHGALSARAVCRHKKSHAAVVRYSTRGNISIRVEVGKRLELAVCNIAPLFIKASHAARLARCKVQFGARFLVSTVAQFTLDFCCAVDCYPPPNSCSWVRDAVVLPITVVLLSCVGGRAFMIAPNRDNGNGFRASDCKIAEYNIFSTLLFFTLLFFVDCFAGNTRKCCFQCISARICVQNGISAPVILFFVVFWDNCVCCLV